MNANYSDELILKMLFEKNDKGLSQLYEIYADYLLNYFKSKFENIDIDIIDSCICDSLIAFSEHPELYKPEKSSLKSYLVMDIRGDILNQIDREKKRKEIFKVVELLPEYGNNEENPELDDNSIDLFKSQILNFFDSIFKEIIDKKIAWMIEIDKVRETNAYVQLLRIEHLSATEQQTEVKKQKDRIIVHLKRKGWGIFIKNLKRDAIR